VRGIPVARDTLRFAAVTPRARFHENVRPGPSFIRLTVPVFPEAVPTQGCRGVAHRCTQCNQADHLLSGDLVPCEMLGRSCFQLCDRSCFAFALLPVKRRDGDVNMDNFFFEQTIDDVHASAAGLRVKINRMVR
jgi:hypothetical protein